MDSEPTRNSASPLFENQDILPIILSFFDPEAFQNGRMWVMQEDTRRNLLSAALTSRAFAGPAISLLWRMLDSVVPPLKLFPNFVSVNDTHTINNVMKADNQDRLASYTRHVKYLYFRNLRETLKWHVVHRLSNLDKPLFPNLEFVNIPLAQYQPHHASTTEMMNMLFLAFSKSLKTIFIHGIDSVTEGEIASYLSVLDQKKAPLQKIVLGGCITHNTLYLLDHFTQLKYLSLDLKDTNLTSSVFISWSSLPFLTHLAVYLHLNASFGLDSNVHRGNLEDVAKFQALQNFRISGAPVELLRILRLMGRSDTLTDIVLDMNASDLRSQTESHLFAVTQADCIRECARFHKSLKALDVITTSGGPRKISLSGESLLCLSACKQLQRLWICGSLFLAANDIIIRQIFSNSCWTNLRILRFPYSVEGNSPSILSLNTIATNCPNLVALHICVDLRLQSYESLKKCLKGNLRLVHNLEALFLLPLAASADTADTNTTKMAIGVSRYIEYHFPYIKTTRLISKNSPADLVWWEEVRILLAEYREIRAEDARVGGS